MDEHTVLEQKKEAASRHFVKDMSETNGEVTDGIGNLLVANFTRDEDGVEMKLGGNRVARERDLDWLLEKFLMLKLTGDPKAYGKALKEFEKIRASLRPVKY